MKDTNIKVIGVKKDKNGHPIIIMKVTLEKKQYVIPTKVRPQCYGKWSGWINKSKNIQCSNCILQEYCKEYFIRKIINAYKIEKDIYERRKQYWGT